MQLAQLHAHNIDNLSLSLSLSLSLLKVKSGTYILYFSI